MNTPAPDYSGLIERLEAEIGDQHLMPGSLIRDAHAAIRDLEADNAGLRDLLKAEHAIRLAAEARAALTTTGGDRHE